MTGEGGQAIKGQQNIHFAPKSHFQNIFKDIGNISIINQMRVIQCFPSFFTINEGKEVVDWVSLK